MHPEYRKGFVLTLLGVLIFTPDTILIRLTSLEFFSLTVGRGTIGGLAILLGLALYYRRDFKKQIQIEIKSNIKSYMPMAVRILIELAEGQTLKESGFTLLKIC